MRDGDMPAEHEWREKGTYSEPRLSEVIDMYKELGFEVRLEPFAPNNKTECTECMRGSAKRYKAVYTRKKN
jgi:hypothetical protein